MEPIETIEYRGYTIEVLPDTDYEHPWIDQDSYPAIVLHDNAERRFGWTTDTAWQQLLTGALDTIANRGVTKKLYGPGGALDIVHRWAKVAHGAKVILPISAIDHSGVAVYLGSGAATGDPGGWDSGWVGWIILDESHTDDIAEWGDFPPQAQEGWVRAAFEEFAAWASGDVVGYRALDPDGEEIASCWGYYGHTESFDRENGHAWEMATAEIDEEIERRSKV